MTAQEETISLDGYTCRYLCKGEGEPLLYFHGSSDGGYWSQTLEQLSHNYRVIAPVHPGFAGTERAEWIETVDDLVFHYLDVLAALDIQRFHLVGLSLGGWIAAEFATRYPERLCSLSLVDAVGIRVSGHPYADLFLLNSDELAPLTFFRPDEIELPGYQDPLVFRRNRRTLAQLAWSPRLHNPKLEERLHRIVTPTLVVWGRQDGIAPLGIGERFVEKIPNAQLKVIDECGHVPNIERPKELADALLDFVSHL